MPPGNMHLSSPLVFSAGPCGFAPSVNFIFNSRHSARSILSSQCLPAFLNSGMSHASSHVKAVGSSLARALAIAVSSFSVSFSKGNKAGSTFATCRPEVQTSKGMKPHSSAKEDVAIKLNVMDKSRCQQHQLVVHWLPGRLLPTTQEHAFL